MKSPLRYPGGKAKLADYFEKIILLNDLKNCEYLEPYAGGSGLAFELLGRGLVSKIRINDNDPLVHAFWHSVLNKNSSFCKMVLSAELSIKEWQRQKSIVSQPDSFSRLEVGFATFYLNRTNRSGIIKGAGVIGGMSQEGKYKIDARYYSETLAARISQIRKFRRSIKLHKTDAMDFVRRYSGATGSLTYLDPPYFEKGHRLYNNFYNKGDHLKIAKCVQTNLDGNWIVSYDNAEEISEMYSERRMLRYSLPYSAAKYRQGSELIIFSDDLAIPAQVSFPMISAA